MELNLPKELNIAINWDNTIGTYENREKIWLDNGYTLWFDLYIYVEREQWAGDYMSPPEVTFNNEEIDIKDLVIYDNNSDEIDDFDKEDLIESIKERIIWS